MAPNHIIVDATRRKSVFELGRGHGESQTDISVFSFPFTLLQGAPALVSQMAWVVQGALSLVSTTVWSAQVSKSGEARIFSKKKR